MKYQWILFDADETLFYFDSFAGLSLMFSRYGIIFTENDFDDYQSVNKPLWVEYQNGTINSQQLQETRFKLWAKVAGVTPKVMNDAYMLAMSEISRPLEGARELMNAIKGKAKLGIITNGFTALQQLRLEHTGFDHNFDIVVISEQIGIAKPDKRLFEHAFSLMQQNTVDLSEILMVGDNPHSDVLGGMNAGIDTCWLNTEGDPCPDGILPTYTVSSLFELQDVLLSHSTKAVKRASDTYMPVK